MDLVEETIKAYSASVDDFVAKHSDINVIKNEADFFISNIKGKKILDVGCGIGRDAKYFSEQGYSITGIDLTPEFIDIAKKNVPSGHFYIADMRKMIFMDDYFDGIWSMASILHIPKKEANKTHFEVGKKVRQTIKELGGAMPENLPSEESIKKIEAKKLKALLPKKVCINL